MMNKKEIIPYNEYVTDLGAATPPKNEKTKKSKNTLIGYVLKRVVLIVGGILLLRVGLWALFPSLVKTPFPPLVYKATHAEETTAVPADASVDDKNCQVKMSVALNGVIMKEGQTYSVKSGDEIKIFAYSTEAEIQRIGYYSNINMDIRDTFDNDATILLPDFETGTKIQLFIEAIATNDDGTANTVTKTGWKKFILVY